MRNLKTYNTLLKTDQELMIIREGGKVLSQMFKELANCIEQGVTTLEIDKQARILCNKFSVKPAFLGYNGYPYSICANVNDTIVHGIPNNYVLKNGDIIGLDFGIIYNDFYLDMSYTFILGNVNLEVARFVDKTKQSLWQGVKACRPGLTIGDISYAMRAGLVGNNFRLMQDFAGHGIGRELHEPPQIPGEGLLPGQGLKIKKGMVFAIEAISVMSSSNNYVVLEDNWTVKTKDGSLSALFECTVIVTDDKPEIVTLF